MAPVESGPTSRFRSNPLSMRSILFSSLFGLVEVEFTGLLLRTGEGRLRLRLDGAVVGDVGDLDPMLNPDEDRGDVLVAMVVFVMGNEYGENLLFDLDANRGPRCEPDNELEELDVNVGDKFGYSGCPGIDNCPNADKPCVGDRWFSSPWEAGKYSP